MKPVSKSKLSESMNRMSDPTSIKDGGESGSDSQTRDSQPIYQDSHGLETCILSSFINKIY